MVRQIKDPNTKLTIARKVLEALHDWFEVDESREKYISDSAYQIFLAAEEDGDYVGFLCLKETGKETVEENTVVGHASQRDNEDRRTVCFIEEIGEWCVRRQALSSAAHQRGRTSAAGLQVPCD